VAVADRYVELHARSAFSFLEGSSVPEELVDLCERFDMPAMALVDRNGVYGAPRFHMAAKKTGGSGNHLHGRANVSIAGRNQARVPQLVKSLSGLYSNSLVGLLVMIPNLVWSGNWICLKWGWFIT